MKRRFASFLSGFLACALIVGVSVSALAISGRMTIEVDPINIQVNGVTFQPTDVNGKDVPVFAYNGTTYAPLRALAEAYGLTVGYDAETNMATVTDPETAPAEDPAEKPANDSSNWSAEDEAAYQEFKAMWETEFTDNVYTFLTLKSGKIEDIHAMIDKYTLDKVTEFCSRLDMEMFDAKPILYVCYRTYTNGEWVGLWNDYILNHKADPEIANWVKHTDP